MNPTLAEARRAHLLAVLRAAPEPMTTSELASTCPEEHWDDLRQLASRGLVNRLGRGPRVTRPYTRRCRLGAGCGKPVLFVILPTGSRMPVDPDPDPEGTVAVYRDASGQFVGRVLKAGEEPERWEQRHVTHFATCPAKAEADRRAKAEKRAAIDRQQPGVTVLADHRAQRAPRGLRGRR